ncbi:SpoIIE family protein phosphatase [Vibrio mimicus]|uniref:SpoIIE family protein phosphatase n=1 Tax=Vibrio mimicus TaxID=674 RepID=UPI0002BA4B2D|nr:SpoIIE family protein phosphatase [Vibrio mimicus]EMB51888.1 indirect negative regulator of sigma-B activity [Vibrio mimicus CAIM 602]MBY7675649.1 SpoIIE family protein phosphatase [Vibrio mimicus]MBY7727464.1 SpoIIE family protein phosphatase [Vibrio mimicus]TXY30977.1 SpoIIE family protein phosphatase [Vibrio mimicus]TXY44485.1 SpoIIE family protein phosphatase [Vibrio mimicus]
MNFDIAVRQVPYFGEPEAGDGYMVYQNEDDLLVVIIDALGHGPNAADLARAMERFLNEKANFDLTWLMQSLHEHFMGSLGAAVTMLHLDCRKNQFSGVGIGNNLLRKVNHSAQSFHAQPGVVGEMIPTLRQFQGTFQPEDWFILTTDGIRENLDLHEADVPWAQSSALRMASYYMDHFSKHHDDATVIVVRCHHERNH